MYDFEKLALSYFFSPEIGEAQSPENVQEKLKKQVELLKKYVTTVKHLSSCPDSWSFLEETYKKTKGDIKLTWNEINFAEFRMLDDSLLLLVYVSNSTDIFFSINIYISLQAKFKGKISGQTQVKNFVNIVNKRWELLDSEHGQKILKNFEKVDKQVLFYFFKKKLP